MNTEHLVNIARNLDRSSDKLATFYHQVNDALRDMHIGLDCWFKVPEQDFEIGYERINSYSSGTWALVARMNIPDEDNNVSAVTWPLYSAPRLIQLAALQHLPTFLELMHVEAVSFVTKAREAVTFAQAIVRAIDGTPGSYTIKADKIVDRVHLTDDDVPF